MKYLLSGFIFVFGGISLLVYTNWPENIQMQSEIKIEKTIDVSNTSTTQKDSDHATNYYNDWKKDYLNETNEIIYVNSSDDHEHPTAISEAQGYGMLVAASVTPSEHTKKDFDKMLAYYMKNRLTESELMSWKQTNADVLPNNATDGDLFIAEALIQASKNWPDNALAYQNQAILILDDIMEYNTNKTVNILTVGNWVASESKESTIFRTSDVVPSFLDDFYMLTGDEKWLDIKNSSITYMKDVLETHQLLPEFIEVKNGKGSVPTEMLLNDEQFDQYAWSSLRIPIMLGLGVPDTQTKEVLNDLLSFFENESVVYATYDVNGNATAGYISDATINAIEYGESKLTNGTVKEQSYERDSYYTNIITLMNQTLK